MFCHYLSLDDNRCDDLIYQIIVSVYLIRMWLGSSISSSSSSLLPLWLIYCDWFMRSLIVSLSFIWKWVGNETLAFLLFPLALISSYLWNDLHILLLAITYFFKAMFNIYVNRKSCQDRDAYYRFLPPGVQHLDAVMRASSDSIAGKHVIINWYQWEPASDLIKWYC